MALVELLTLLLQMAYILSICNSNVDSKMTATFIDDGKTTTTSKVDGKTTTSFKVDGKTTSTFKDDYILKVDEMTKSENDDRAYRYITLKNNLRLLLVSDPRTDKAAASVTLNAGYSSDPDSVPGIAHFCEHMLFLGTEKYPKESGFGLFLSQYNGRTNAYTSSEYTAYYFDINAEFLAPALDRFAQFFISPTFNQNSTDRELNAIEQEHQKNLLDDYHRIYYIVRQSAKKGHRWGAFGTGNLETLKTIPRKNGINIRDKLLEFYNKYYSANIMTVAIAGKQSLDDLEQIAVPLFKGVRNNDVTMTSYEADLPYGPHEMNVVLKIPTIKEMHRFEVKFQIMYLQKHYRAKPSDFLSQVIGHEGRGSLLSYLKSKGWAYNLWAGDRRGLKGFNFFIIGMDLTQDGLAHVNDIITAIFQYVKMLKREGPKQWIYQEMSAINNNRFRYKDKERTNQYVQALAKDMHLYAPIDILVGHYQYSSFQPDLITKILNSLTPRNFRYFLASHTFRNQTNTHKVDHFGAEYKSERIPETLIRDWEQVKYNDKLFLPHKNLFIPEALKIVVPRRVAQKANRKTTKNIAALIRDTPFSRVWFKADDTFYVPKTSMKLVIYSAHASLTPSHFNHLIAFARLLRDAMIEYGYDADLAGINYSIRWLFTGLLVTVDGFSSKQATLMRKIIGYIVSLKFKRETFLMIKQQILDSLNNMELSLPYTQTEEFRNNIINDRVWTTEEYLHYMDELTYESLQDYIPKLLKDIYIESLYCGNIIKEDALAIQNEIEHTFKTQRNSREMLSNQHVRSREYILPPGRNFLFESRSKIHAFSAVQLYLQVGLQNERNNILCELFWQMTNTLIFSKLRTQQQLGYIVISGLSRSHSAQGIRVQVQSDKDPMYVEQRIDAFLKDYAVTLESMTESEFQKFVDAMIVRKLERPTRMSWEAHVYAMEIFIKHYNFRRGEKEAAALKKLKKSDMLEFFKQYIDPSSRRRRKLVVVVLGKNATNLTSSSKKSPSNWTLIRDVTAFKTRLPLYQHVMPHDSIPLVVTSSKKKG